MNTMREQNTPAALLAMLLSLCAQYLSFSLWPLYGAHSMYFSASMIATPLIGHCGGPILLMIYTILHCIKYGTTLLSGSLSCSVLFIPGIIAGYYLSTESRTRRLLLISIPAFLFVMHPVGSQSLAYASYWMIPLILSGITYRTLFLEALAATFVAHAVGSCLWIYTTPTTTASWYALVPVVWYERLITALGIYLLHHLLVRITQYASQYRTHTDTIPHISQ